MKNLEFIVSIYNSFLLVVVIINSSSIYYYYRSKNDQIIAHKPIRFPLSRTPT